MTLGWSDVEDDNTYYSGAYDTHVVWDCFECWSVRDKSIDDQRLIEDDGSSQCSVAVLRQKVPVQAQQS